MKRSCRSPRVLRSLFFLLGALQIAALLVAFERPARAYVDPGSGFVFLQVAGSMFAGALYYMRHRLKRLFGMTRRSSPNFFYIRYPDRGRREPTMSQGASQDDCDVSRPSGVVAHPWRTGPANGSPPLCGESLRFLQSDLARRWTEQGHLVGSQVLSAEAGQPLLLEHPRIFFPSYPWEWTPGQWVAAGELTLELCSQLLHEGWILKDATPLNILFEGSRPVFVDLLSIERRDPSSPLWLAYGQFARTFLLPLAAYKQLGWPLAATQNRRDGYEPVDLYPYLSAVERWSAPLCSLVTLPYLFEKRKGRGGAPPKLKQAPEIATAVLERNFKGFARALHALEPKGRDSRWSEYQTAADHYTDQERQHKQEFVDRAMQLLRPGSVLDIGGNTGQYSRIAASVGARVVAWDTDVASSDLNWREARTAGLPILPLVADVARPTPAVGWCNTRVTHPAGTGARPLRLRHDAGHSASSAACRPDSHGRRGRAPGIAHAPFQHR